MAEKFDSTYFDRPVSRRQSGSYKWDSTSDDEVIPLWVADMDFCVAPAIQRALEKRVAHGVFGYVKVPDEYYDATSKWFSRRHGWTIKRDDVIYTSGVVPAISAIIKAMTKPGDKVLVQTPVYNCFFSSIRNNGCKMEANPLVRRSIDGNRFTYDIDFEDFEKKASDNEVKVFLLCNPHNPAGRVWTRDELMKMAKICKKHNVFVISDEIHCELMMPGYQYTPFGSLGEEIERNAAICISPSKSFNTAGLQIANIVAIDAEILKRIDKAININEVCDVNPFGVTSLIAAYNESEPWLNGLLGYINGNYVAACEFIDANMPQCPIAILEGTYLMWVDISKICSTLNIKVEDVEERLVGEAHVWPNAGTHYGEDGEGYIRINLATQRATLIEGLRRIAQWIKTNC